MFATPFRLLSTFSLEAGSCGDDGCMPSVQRWVEKEDGVNYHVSDSNNEFRAEVNNSHFMMPNQLQWVFLSSFVLTLAFLVLVSQVIAAKLREAGYPISHLILIGLNNEDTKSQRSMSSFAVPALLVTASLVLLTIVYNKFLRSGLFLFVCFHFSLTKVARSKPLDPNKWKEFPLEKKVQVSPNTAM